MTPAVSSWQPQDQSLHDLLILLRDAFRSDNRDQLMLQQVGVVYSYMYCSLSHMLNILL